MKPKLRLMLKNFTERKSFHNMACRRAEGGRRIHICFGSKSLCLEELHSVGRFPM
jgi:hypothetical protein